MNSYAGTANNISISPLLFFPEMKLKETTELHVFDNQIQQDSEKYTLEWRKTYWRDDIIPQIISNFRWLESFYLLKNRKIQNAGITGEFLSKINEMLNSGRLAECNQLLEEVEVENLNPVFMVALVRGSFAARENLTNWCSCRDKVKECLDTLGYDGRSVLSGLY